MTSLSSYLTGVTDDDREQRAQEWLDQHYPEHVLSNIFRTAASDQSPYHYIVDNFMAVEGTQAFEAFKEKLARRGGGFAKTSFDTSVGLQGRVDTLTFWTKQPTTMSRMSAWVNKPCATYLA